MIAEATLTTEQMLLVMELAGWTYFPETSANWATVSPDGQLSSEHRLCAAHTKVSTILETEAWNVHDLFNQFIQHQEGKT